MRQISSVAVISHGRILDTVDQVVAVWDGRPADGQGGTGDVVVKARELRIPVTVIWPDGARRD